MPDATHGHAYLVLAHEDVKMLNILTQRLVHTGYVHIHLDRSSQIQITDVINDPEVRVTKQIKVNWGGYSIIEANPLLADQALADNSTRLTLLSGLSYPIASDVKLNEVASSILDYIDAGDVDLNTQPRPFIRRFSTQNFSFHLSQNFYGYLVRRLSRELWSLAPKLDPINKLASIKLTLGCAKPI
jgi:hypothetical protein